MKRLLQLGVLVAALLAAALLAGRAAAADPPGLSAAIAAQQRHAEALLMTPGIVGTGIGVNAAGRAVIRIYTRYRGAPGVPAQLDGVPTEVLVTGEFVPRAPTDRFARPVPIGVSTGHPDITAGTIGARVRASNGNVFALSNNHVYANVNNASIGDGALQPGPYDGGTDPADRIGTLYDFEPIKFDGSNNTIDAAIALSSTANLGTSTPADGYGTPSSTTMAAFVGQAVKKYGRTTALTFGQVSEINVTVNVCYAGVVICTKIGRFVGQVGVTPGSFSAGGDSGSLIVTQAGNNPVALLFAGSSSRTLGNPIGAVLSRFGVTIDTGSSPPPTLSSIAVTPASATINVGQTQQFTATGTYSDSSTANLTSSATWSSSNTSAATISSSGLATGQGAGTALITAAQGGVTSNSATLTVQQAAGITLTATGSKVRGLQRVTLSWTGATTATVNIRRRANGGAEVVIASNVPNSPSSYTDDTGKKGKATYDYRVCEGSGTTVCSNVARVTFG